MGFLRVSFEIILFLYVHWFRLILCASTQPDIRGLQLSVMTSSENNFRLFETKPNLRSLCILEIWILDARGLEPRTNSVVKLRREQRKMLGSASMATFETATASHGLLWDTIESILRFSVFEV